MTEGGIGLNAPDFRIQLLQGLGIDVSKEGLKRATLVVRAGAQWPVLTLVRELRPTSVEQRQLAIVRERFTLQPVEQAPAEAAPFDLDVAVADACGRVGEFIQLRAASDAWVIAASAKERRYELDRQWRAQDRAAAVRRTVVAATLDKLSAKSSRKQSRMPVRSFDLKSAAQTAAGVAFLALTLGWLGPRLDESFDGTATQPRATAEALGQVAWLDAEARARCHAAGTLPGEYLPTTDGGIVCATPAGRQRGGAR